ncbi:hypothetical protein ACHHYP_20282, partial [Achlya hypogyna]
MALLEALPSPLHAAVLDGIIEHLARRLSLDIYPLVALAAVPSPPSESVALAPDADELFGMDVDIFPPDQTTPPAGWTAKFLDPLAARGLDAYFVYDADTEWFYVASCGVASNVAEDCRTQNKALTVSRATSTSHLVWFNGRSTEADIEATARILRRNPYLRELSLSSSCIDFTEESDPPTHYFGPPIPEALVPCFWRALHRSFVTDLELKAGNLFSTPAAARQGIQWLQERPVYRLRLQAVIVDESSAGAVAGALSRCTTLQVLELVYDRYLMPAFLAAPLPPSLRRLCLNVNDVDYPHNGFKYSNFLVDIGLANPAAYLAQAIAGSQLTHLSVNVAGLDDAGTALVFETALTRLPLLQHLKLTEVVRGPSLDAAEAAVGASIHSSAIYTLS